MEEYENFDAMQEAARRIVERWEQERDVNSDEDSRGDGSGGEDEATEPRQSP